MPIPFDAFRAAFEPGKHPRDSKGEFSALATLLGPKSKAAQLASAAKPAAPAAAPAKPMGGGLSLAGLASALPPKQPASRAVLSPQAYEALRPQRQWSPGMRRQALDALGSGEDQKALADTLARFQDGGNIARLRTKIDRHVNGEPVDPTSERRARVLLDAVRNAPPDMAPPSLHRGMRVAVSQQTALARYKAGDDLNLNLSSFTSDRKQAVRFTDEMGTGKTKVLIELVGQKHALPIQNLTEDHRLFREREWVTTGKFRIVSAKASPQGGVLLKIEQVAPL